MRVHREGRPEATPSPERGSSAASGPGLPRWNRRRLRLCFFVHIRALSGYFGAKFRTTLHLRTSGRSLPIPPINLLRTPSVRHCSRQRCRRCGTWRRQTESRPRAAGSGRSPTSQLSCMPIGHALATHHWGPVQATIAKSSARRPSSGALGDPWTPHRFSSAPSPLGVCAEPQPVRLPESAPCVSSVSVLRANPAFSPEPRSSTFSASSHGTAIGGPGRPPCTRRCVSVSGSPARHVETSCHIAAYEAVVHFVLRVLVSDRICSNMEYASSSTLR